MMTSRSCGPVLHRLATTASKRLDRITQRALHKMQPLLVLVPSCKTMTTQQVASSGRAEAEPTGKTVSLVDVAPMASVSKKSKSPKTSTCRLISTIEKKIVEVALTVTSTNNVAVVTSWRLVATGCANLVEVESTLMTSRYPLQMVALKLLRSCLPRRWKLRQHSDARNRSKKLKKVSLKRHS